MASLRVLLAVTGGIAAYKAPDLVRRLRDFDLEVRCALTATAEAFVSPLALEVVTEHRVYGESYLEPGRLGEEEHISVTDWAEVLLVAPATANTLARMAQGIADDFVATTALAWDGPTVVAPAMHPRMWNHPAMRHNAGLLIERGVRFVGPVVGPLASGETGIGRMAEPELIADTVRRAGRVKDLAGRRVLVGAGPTREPLDPVRYVGNRSSGKMGFSLAAEAAERGADVQLVAGPVLLPTPVGVDRRDVETTVQMRDEMVRLAPQADLILMTAAVADFRPVRTEMRKLKKEEGIPHIDLLENPDILREMVPVAGGVVVGFAAETENLFANSEAKLARKGCDYLVANDVSRRDIAFGSDWNEVTIFSRGGPPIEISRRPKRDVARLLLDHFRDALEQRAQTAG